MQTFFADTNVRRAAKYLDNKRLGKQRVEAIQIANILLGFTNSNAWKNHPAVLMWKGYESYLIKIYLRTIMNEWISRGFKNEKCEQHYIRLCQHVSQDVHRPKWLTPEFVRHHRSNLLRKDKAYYQKFWNDIPDNLEYLWGK